MGEQCRNEVGVVIEERSQVRRGEDVREFYDLLFSTLSPRKLIERSPRASSSDSPCARPAPPVRAAPGF